MSLIGPIVIGLAVWCAAGHVTVASPDTATLRIAIPAPWWIGVGAAVGAWLVPAWRRRPVLSTPALLSTLPWWPVALPPAALIWTGPLAWVPIALALAGVAAAPGSGSRPSTHTVAKPSHATALAFVLTLAAGLLAAWAADPRVPGGDEPHYLVITQSLLKDGDLRIENNHANRDYASFFAGDLKPDQIQRGRNRQIYSIHAPGVPVVVLPAFWGFGYRGAQGTLLLLAAICGALIWRIAWRVTESADAAWFAWAAVVGSSTFLLQSFMIFPDGPGALAVAVGVWALARLHEPGHVRPADAGPSLFGPRALVGTSAALAALPWLHTRFAVLAAGFGVAIVWRVLADGSRPVAARARQLVAFLALPVLSAIAWFTYFLIIYGTLKPTAPYGSSPETSWTYVPGGVTALMFDQQYGLLIYAPVLAFAIWEIGRARRDAPGQAIRATATIALVYLAASATYWMWWAGNPATPARLAAAVLPVFAVPLAAGWARASRSGRILRLLILGLSIATSVLIIGVNRADLAWNVRDGQARWLEWLGPVVNLPRGWPSFFWRLDPGRVSSEVPFFVHVLAWIAVLTALGWALRALLRRRTAAGVGPELGMVWCAAIAVMALVQIGWWLNGANGLDPARSQLGALGAMTAGRPAIRLAGFSVERVAHPGGALHIRGEEPGVGGDRTWAVFARVPAGLYELQIVTRRPQAGEVSVRVGRAPRPFRVQPLAPLSRQGLQLALPAGAESLTIAPDEALGSVGAEVELMLLRPIKDAPAGRARAAVRYGATDVFFLDDGVFVEAEGFWVRGGRTAAVLATSTGRSSIDLHLRNGATAHAISLDAGTRRDTLSLGPGEERAITLPLSTDGVVRFTLTAPSGFRPSDQGQADTRYLGVWVELR